MNAEVEGEEIGGVVDKWDVDGINENGEYLVDTCAETDLFLTNIFQHKTIHRYTWTGGNKRNLIDYVAVDKWMNKEAMDVKIVKEMFNGSSFCCIGKSEDQNQMGIWGK